jgi:tRNA pseudouridine55 synthase
MVKRERLEGALLINKPPGPTSHDIVDEARRILRTKRIGHTGTLDPFAAGLLVLLLGPATRLAEYLKDHEKTYRGVIRLGVKTDTDDVTGTVIKEKTVPPLSARSIENEMKRFRGKSSQKAPAYSAVKVSGERLYRRARRGAEVKAPTREIEIYSLSLVGYNRPDLVFEVTCSSGTYVRALARDIGEALGCGAHLTSLTRTAAGPYELSDSITIDELKTGDIDIWREKNAFIPMAEVLPDFPTIEITGEDATRVSHGKEIALARADEAEGLLVKLVLDGTLAAVGRVDGDSVRPVKVFLSQPPHG